MKLSAWKKSKLEQAMVGYMFLLPAVVALCVFLVGPIFYAIYVSFFRYNSLNVSQKQFIGLENFVHLFHDPMFGRALLNTSIYAVVVVPVQTAIALFLALIVNSIKGKTFFRVVYYLPTVTSTVATSLMFMFIFEPQGLLNSFLKLFGIHGPNYFNSPTFALPAIIALAVWSSVGQFMIIYLAGIQDLSDEVYEAAALDGATGWKLLRHITLPLLRRTTFLNVVLSLIGCFQVFDQMYVISGGTGGPLNSTLSVVLDLYNQATSGNMGYASAIGIALFIIILILTLIQKLIFEREEA
ncbi:carbohydrate ABC transporter permease [Alicyclobacillus acidiphilus]|uniref:carbohydrate ABC transporter permease n=1 Tax=Alicyclobacillus acidiphilus TaxID=182455 RepID=UPI000AAA1969|nr:sugar ABC transporter permease [Alicyclobacillus acidiphilus]